MAIFIYLLFISSIGVIFSIILLFFISEMNWISPLFITAIGSAIGASIGAYVSFSLAAKHFLKQENERLKLQKSKDLCRVTNGLLEEIKYIEDIIDRLNIARNELLNKMPNKEFSDNPSNDILDDMIKFLIQWNSHYSIKKYEIFHSIGSELGIFKPSTLEKILLLYYELDFLHIQFDYLIKISTNQKYIPSFLRKMEEMNNKINVHINSIKGELESILKENQCSHYLR